MPRVLHFVSINIDVESRRVFARKPLVGASIATRLLIPRRGKVVCGFLQQRQPERSDIANHQFESAT
jgi:hypothetical protein